MSGNQRNWQPVRVSSGVIGIDEEATAGMLEHVLADEQCSRRSTRGRRCSAVTAGCSDGRGGGIRQGNNPAAARMVGKCVAREALTILKRSTSDAVNAEIYTGIGQRIKFRSPLANTIVSALGNGSAGSGYIPTEEAFNRYTFQVLGSRLKPGCAEDGIVNAAVELLTDATK